MNSNLRDTIKVLLRYSIPFNWVIHAFQRTIFELRHVFLAFGLLHALLDFKIIKVFFKSSIVRTYMLFITAVVISVLTTNTGWEGLFEMAVWLLYMLAAFAAAHIDRDALAKTFILTPITLAVLYLGVQAYTLFFGPISGVNAGSRMQLFMYTSSRLGFIASMCILYLISRFSFEIKNKNKIFISLLLSLNAIILYQSYTRSSILSCLMLSFALVFLIYRSNRLIKLVFIGFVLIFMMYFAIDDSNMTQRFTVLLENPMADRNIAARLSLWHVAWETFLAHPFFGINFSQFETTYRDFLAANPQIFEQFTVVNPSHTQAHNLALELMAGSGITGLITFGVFIVTVLKKSWANTSTRYTLFFFVLAFLLEGLTNAAINRWIYMTVLAPFIGILIYDDTTENPNPEHG